MVILDPCVDGRGSGTEMERQGMSELWCVIVRVCAGICNARVSERERRKESGGRGGGGKRTKEWKREKSWWMSDECRSSSRAVKDGSFGRTNSSSRIQVERMGIRGTCKWI